LIDQIIFVDPLDLISYAVTDKFLALEIPAPFTH
jgi:hypothetical protein